MTHPEEDIFPQEIMGPPEVAQSHIEVEPPDAPEELSCPVCDRIIPPPFPESCPHCQAPIGSIMALLRTADLSLDEAMRDLRIGDLDSAERRLEYVHVTSKRHRVRMEIIRALVDRLRGDPASALARLKAIKDSMEEADRQQLIFFEDVELLCLNDQEALALCCEQYNFALFQARRGHYEEARQSLRKALVAVPHHAPSHAMLGKIQLALQEHDDASYHLKRALASDPGNPVATRLLSRMGRASLPNPLEIISARFNISPAWAGSILVIIILTAIALTALLNN